MCNYALPDYNDLILFVIDHFTETAAAYGEEMTARKRKKSNSSLS